MGKKKSGVIAEVWHNYENSELFETGKYFTLSGKQNGKPEEFKKPEQKAPLTYWLQTGDGPKTVTETARVTIDELYERKAITKNGRKRK